MIRLNTPLSKASGQCYDCAKNMCGIKNGVSNKILSENPKAFLTHCVGHALNLAAGEISNLIKKSPKRDAMLQKIRKDISLEYPGFIVLCPTKWTIKAESMKNILDNWVALQQVCDESLNEILDAEIKGRIIGVKSQTSNFNYFYGITILQSVLRHSDNLSKTFQKPSLTSCQGKKFLI